jgi:hypothetical protein
MSSLNQPAARTPAASREAFVEQEFHAGRDLQSGNARATPATADDVVEFWRRAGPSMWFAKDADFDRRFREAFLGTHEAAARGELDGWLATPTGALALLLLLDQFPRNAFRGTPRAGLPRPPSTPAAISKCRPISGRFSICPLAIPRSSPIRNAAWLYAVISGRRTPRIPSAIATSCGASGAFLIAIRFSAGT